MFLLFVAAAAIISTSNPIPKHTQLQEVPIQEKQENLLDNKEQHINVVDAYHIIVYDKNLNKLDSYQIEYKIEEYNSLKPNKLKSYNLEISSNDLFCYEIHSFRIFQTNDNVLYFKENPYFIIKNKGTVKND